MKAGIDMTVFRKFLVRCLIALVPLLFICIYAKANALAFMDEEAPYYLWNKEKSNTKQNQKYDVIILGDSTANAAFVPGVLSDKTINLALGGTTPVENYYVLQDWLQSNPPPSVCYISFTDTHLQSEDCFWKRTIYTHRFNVKQNVEMLLSAIQYDEKSILTENYLSDFIFYQLWLPNKYKGPLLDAGFVKNIEVNIKAQENDEMHGGRYIARGIKEYAASEEIEKDSFSVNPLFDDYYRRIMKLCVDNNIIVRIVKLPLPDYVRYTDRYLKEAKAYYSDLKDSYPNVTVDFSPLYLSVCFADTHHLNSRGALQFSTELKEMYPQDFDFSEISSNQIAAINDEIMTENKIEWILKWMAGRNYTMVIRDTSGTFTRMYEDQIKEKIWDGGPELHSLDVIQEPFSDFYYILGDEDSFGTQPVDLFEKNIENKVKEIGTWGGISEKRLDLLVIDDYNDAVICQKTYRYADKEYIYGQ